MAETILYLIALLVVLGFFTDLYLDWLNLNHAPAEVPEALRDFYTPEKYREALAYHREHFRLGLVSGTLSTALLLVLLFTGFFGSLDQWVQARAAHPVVQALLFFGILGLGAWLLSIPFSAWKTFVIEERFGFNKTTPSVFITDRFKELALGSLFAGGLLVNIVFLYLLTGKWFWVFAWLLVLGFSSLLSMFYTAVLLPVFNKLTPLDEGPLRDAITAYARKTGFPLGKISVMDGSKRSSKANAFFSGLGRRKDIVLYDTLIEKHTRGELVAVLAHEVGHYRKKHILKGLLLSAFTTGLVFALFGWMLQHPEPALALGADSASFHLTALAFALIFQPLSLLTGWLGNYFSRKFEFEADRFAAETYGAGALADALRKLSTGNLSFPWPHPWYVSLHYSHPPAWLRVKVLRQLENKLA